MTKEEKIELVKEFLEGKDPQPYITGIEGDYYNNEVHLMIDHPEKGKYMERQHFEPFAFVKDFKKIGKQLYPNDTERNKAMLTHGIKIKKLRTDSHPRLEWGYTHRITSSKKLLNITQFFSKAGFDLFKDPDRLFISNSGIEQFLMSTGKRLFKGYESYSDIHKLYFDLETTGLDPNESSIFLIGLKDNRGFNKVLAIDRDNPLESERQMIIYFFNLVVELKPAVVAGYNSEAFDFNFLIVRAGILGIDLGTKDQDGNYTYDCRTSLRSETPMKRKASTVKFGSETEKYVQTIMWGINVVDISFAVRKAQAINSDIKKWGLKYICQYSNIAKADRMYVPDGNKIYKIWKENKWYYINKKNNSYKEIPQTQQHNPIGYKRKLKEWVERGRLDNEVEAIKRVNRFFDDDVDNIDVISGEEIINQYLLDDLYETEMVDNTYNQSSFMVGKIAPTGFVRASTMGNASLWKLLMLTYSYENNLAIPTTDRKRDITGGLSRLVTIGYAKNVLKMDFASLYPSIQLTWNVFPSFDITGVLEAMLTYFRDARIQFNGLKKKYKEEGNMELSNFYDVKQLPIKILANSNFGALSSPAIFNWGDNNIGEQITCTGRQCLRLMIWHFQKYGFQPLVGDTDGFNFSIPDNSENIICYDKNGQPYKGMKKVDGVQKECILTGYEAVLEEFNDLYMYGVMKLAEDGIYQSTINFARKNYADLLPNGKVKLVGASIKSKTIQTYIEEFLDKAILLLLHGKGKEFVEEYYAYVKIIYNKEIPLIKIANKAKVKMRVESYKYKMANTVQTNGRPPARQAHMELMIENNLNPDMGEVIYYINNGTAKSHGDLNNSYLIDFAALESNPDLVGNYNIARYVDNFNKKVKTLLVCFGLEVRNTILVKNPKDIQYYTDNQMELVSGIPVKIEDQDGITFEDYLPGQHKNVPLYEMEEKEIKFWNKVRIDPRTIFPHFTTNCSETKLIDFDDKTYDVVYPKLVDYFKSKEVVIKPVLDFLMEGDLVITNDNNKWELKKYEYGELELLQEIPEDLITELAN